MDATTTANPDLTPAPSGGDGRPGERLFAEPAHGQPEQRRALRWHSATRYYVALVQRNLFQEWECVRYWGGRGVRLGRSMSTPAVDLEDALSQLASVERTRRMRGYARVPLPPS